MFDVERRTKKFNTDDEAELREYDSILSDPLCSILAERKEKLRNEYYDNDGNMIRSEEHIILVVTWEQKVIF